MENLMSFYQFAQSEIYTNKDHREEFYDWCNGHPNPDDMDDLICEYADAQDDIYIPLYAEYCDKFAQQQLKKAA